MTVDVIIPTYKPDKSFITLLSKLCEQTVKVNRVIVVNTCREFWQFSEEELKPFENIATIRHIEKSEFDHGNTRHMAILESEADICVLMTMDAMPVDDRLIEKLTAPFDNEKVAITYGRQMAYQYSSAAEKLIREFNYPAVDAVKGIDDLQRLGIKTYFCSNVCSAYRREIYLSLGGFVRKTIFNEDMLFASKAVKAGWLIAYAAEASVYHSHDYKCMQQFKRNFDNGVSHAMYPEVFEGITQEGEGMRMVKHVIKGLLKQGRLLEIPGFVVKTGFRYIGFKQGCRYKKLSEKKIQRYTSNPDFFNNIFLIK